MRSLLPYACTLLLFFFASCGNDGLLPSISSITTKKGKAEGTVSIQTEVTIRGTHFSDDAAITFGNLKASAVTVQNETTLLATTPDEVFLSGEVSVTLTTGGQIVVKDAAFVYVPLLAFASNRTGAFEIYTMENDGNTVQRITSSDPGVINESPVFSPSGREMLFTSNRTGNFELFMMERNGSNPHNLTNNKVGTDQQAAFSPDGRQIVFISNRKNTASNPESDFEVFLMDSDGGNVKQLTANNADERSPVFSPDGSRILFTSNRDRDRELFLINVDGTGGAQQLTHNTDDDHDPMFSPDGKQILFVSNRTGQNELHVIDIDGGNPLPLTTSQGNVSAPSRLNIPGHGIEIIFSSDQTGNKEIFLISCKGDQARALTRCDETGTKNLSLHIDADIAPSPSP